ncbi:hypothetical protein ACFYXM_11720 [Streptomyces sp. NPDC002476]|uniref:hypothetical protein n=1 Tax=Streptomyces sp. NPDC002476 TaxID=3364648 RepID=UPI0036BF6E9C
MKHTKLTAETQRGTKDILRSALNEINAELLRRHPGDQRAQYEAHGLPLRMTIHLDVNEEKVPTRTLTAETVNGAKDILNSALQQIQAEKLRQHPGDSNAQYKALDEPMRTWIHFNLADLDREGPLSIDECRHLPYDVLKGLKPSADHQPDGVVTRSVPARRPQRTLGRRVLGSLLGTDSPHPRP